MRLENLKVMFTISLSDNLNHSNRHNIFLIDISCSNVIFKHKNIDFSYVLAIH